MPIEPRVTVVCTQRDHHHDTTRSLDALLARTTVPFDLVYVLCPAPRKVTADLRRRAIEDGFTLVEPDRYLTPNQARNGVMDRVETEYVAFVDNDAIVTDGWLEGLLDCADATGAALVGPLQLYGPLEDGAIHLAGGWLHLDKSTSPRTLRIEHRYQGLGVDEVPEPLRRERCHFAEYHCMLARTAVLAEVGPLDEGFLSAREVEDLAFRVAAVGGSVWFEPEAVVAFLPPTELRHLRDVTFISRRWGERANRASHEHFLTKYDLNRSHLSALGFANCQRRPIFGGLRRILQRFAGERVARVVDYGLHLAERPVNRLLVRLGPSGPT